MYLIFSLVSVGFMLWALVIFYRATSNLPELRPDASRAAHDERKALSQRRVRFYLLFTASLGAQAYLWLVTQPDYLWGLISVFSLFLWLDARSNRIARALVDKEAEWFRVAGQPLSKPAPLTGKVIYINPDFKDGKTKIKQRGQVPPSESN